MWRTPPPKQPGLKFPRITHDDVRKSSNIFLAVSWKGTFARYLCRQRLGVWVAATIISGANLLVYHSWICRTGRTVKVSLLVPWMPIRIWFLLKGSVVVVENQKQRKSISRITAVAFSLLQLGSDWMAASKQPTVCPLKVWLDHSYGNIVVRENVQSLTTRGSQFECTETWQWFLPLVKDNGFSAHDTNFASKYISSISLANLILIATM